MSFRLIEFNAVFRGEAPLDGRPDRDVQEVGRRDARKRNGKLDRGICQTGPGHPSGKGRRDPGTCEEVGTEASGE